LWRAGCTGRARNLNQTDRGNLHTISGEGQKRGAARDCRQKEGKKGGWRHEKLFFLGWLKKKRKWEGGQLPNSFPGPDWAGTVVAKKKRGIQPREGREGEDKGGSSKTRRKNQLWYGTGMIKYEVAGKKRK